MGVYNAPLRDMKFVLREMFNGSDLQKFEGYGDFNDELVDAVLEEAGKISSEVL